MKWIVCHKKLFLITTLPAIFILSMLVIVLLGARDHVFKADLLVVLGNKVSPTGVPSSGLSARLNKAIELYQQGYAPYIFVSGGTGKEGFNEAIAMSNYLIKRGIPESAIIKDPLGINTRATAQNTYQYMKRHNLKSAIIVSQYYHIARAKLALRRAGITKIGQASPGYLSPKDLYSVTREVVGYPTYWLNIR